MTKAILITGQPRTGSSIIAGTLQRLGVFVGLQLMPADDWNPAGHYSDEEWEFLLTDWLGSNVYPETLTPTIPADIDARITALVNARSEHPIWAVKWSQTPYLFRPLDQRGLDIVVLRGTRDLQRCIDSTVARIADGEANRDYVASWVTAAKNAADMLASDPGVIEHQFDFDDMINDPATFVTDVAAAVGVDPDASVASWINPELRRF